MRNETDYEHDGTFVSIEPVPSEFIETEEQSIGKGQVAMNLSSLSIPNFMLSKDAAYVIRT